MSKNLKKAYVNFLMNEANLNELDMLEHELKSNQKKSVFANYFKINYAMNLSNTSYDSKKAKKKILETIRRDKLKQKKIFKIYSYVTAASLLIGLFFLFILNNENTNKNDIQVVNHPIVKPGTDKAILTIETGENIPLFKGSGYHNKNISSNGEQINCNTNTTKSLVYNYLTIPKGGQFHLTLSDGTKVWLNSDSQLKFPVAFKKGKPRTVELLYGEAYFKVSPSSKHNGAKFKVLNKHQSIEVLGTEFNLKAYLDDDCLFTTLVEGKITVDINNKKEILKPNQQLQLNPSQGYTIINNEIDVMNVILWKDGIFNFKGKSLKEIMKVISRWYNIDVVFKNKELEDIKFIGVLGKDQDLENILLTIKTLSVIKNYEINGKVISIE